MMVLVLDWARSDDAWLISSLLNSALGSIGWRSSLPALACCERRSIRIDRGYWVWLLKQRDKILQ